MQLASEIKDVCGSKSQIRFEPLPEDDPILRRPDITRAVKTLGWQPQVSRKAGLKKTLEYFKVLSENN